MLQAINTKPLNRSVHRLQLAAVHLPVALHAAGDAEQAGVEDQAAVLLEVSEKSAVSKTPVLFTSAGPS